MITSSQKRLLALAGLFLVLILAAGLRVVNLRAFPGWYSDEGYFIDFAANLRLGQFQNFCTSGAPYLERPPLYPYLLLGSFNLFGVDILASRALSAACNIAAAGLLALLAWRIGNRRLALWAAGLYALLPWVVAYNRMGLTYNLATPLFLLAVIGCWLFLQKPSTCWMLLGAVACGLAASTDYLGAAAVLLAWGAWLVGGRRWLLPGIGITLLVMASAWLPLVASNPQLWLQDIATTLTTRSGMASPGGLLLNVLVNFTELLRRESWILLGLVGIFLLSDRRLRALVWGLVGVTLLVVTRSLPPVGRALHYLIPLFPFFALGLAAFIDKAVGLIYTEAGQLVSSIAAAFPTRPELARSWAYSRRLFGGLAVFFLVGGPLLWMLFADVALVGYGSSFLFTGNDELNLSPAEDVDRVSEFLRQNARPEDLVLASPQIAWAAPVLRRADFRNQEAYDGLLDGTPLELPPRRFLYPCGLGDAAYVVLDPLSRQFAPQVLPGMQAAIQRVESWPRVFQSGEIDVYRNPK